jgi:hypothetical protein
MDRGRRRSFSPLRLCNASSTSLIRGRRRRRIRRLVVPVASYTWRLAIGHFADHHAPIAPQRTIRFLVGGIRGLALPPGRGEFASFAFAAASHAWWRARVIDACQLSRSVYLKHRKQQVKRTSKIALDLAFTTRVACLVSATVGSGGGCSSSSSSSVGALVDSLAVSRGSAVGQDILHHLGIGSGLHLHHDGGRHRLLSARSG